MPKPARNIRQRTADLIRELRAVPTPFLSRREKNRAIRSNARTFLRFRRAGIGN